MVLLNECLRRLAIPIELMNTGGSSPYTTPLESELTGILKQSYILAQEA